MELTVHNVIIIMCIVDVGSFIHITDCNNCDDEWCWKKGVLTSITHNTQSEYGFKYKGIFIVCSFCPHTQYLHVCKLVPTTQTEFVRVLFKNMYNIVAFFIAFFFARSSSIAAHGEKETRETNHHNHQYTLLTNKTILSILLVPSK